MSPRAYVGRFAPSPTGAMHLGIARTCLAAWLDARAHGGRILLRIEDVDRPRTAPGAADGLKRDLEWLGLGWDGDPVVQSERDVLYEAALAHLRALGRVYGCNCTRGEVARAASAPHGPSDEGPRYPGTCRAGLVPKHGRGVALRLATEPGDVVAHEDRLYGPTGHDVHAVVGDFVIRRGDGLWAYQLAVTVDDVLQGVTCVVRGSDLLTSTPRQLLLRRLLDPEAPPLDTLHVPLVRGPDGKRLAKRDGAAAIAARRASGEPPEVLVGALAASLDLVPPGTACRAEELIAGWDIRRLSREDQRSAPD